MVCSKRKEKLDVSVLLKVGSTMCCMNDLMGVF